MKVDFEGSGPAYKSYMGAVVSIIFIAISCFFLYSKVIVLVYDLQVTTMSVIKEHAIDMNDRFTSETGIFYAAAISAWDHEPENPVDLHKYGELVFYANHWGFIDDKPFVNRKYFETHDCSDEELGLHSTSGEEN